MAPRDRQPAPDQAPVTSRRPPARPPVGSTVASLHQAVGNRAIAQIVARRTGSKGRPFYKEVLDAIAEEKARGFRIQITDKVKGSLVAMGLPRLYRLLRLCRAVEAEDADETKAAAKELLGQDDVRPWVSEDLANELISRTQLMGLQTASDRLKTWLREHTDEPLSKGTFRADRDLWDMTSSRALDRARRMRKGDSLDDLDLLLRIFRLTFREAASLNADKLRVDREIRNEGDSPVATVTISKYDDELVAILGRLHAGIERRYEALLDDAVADLEAGKGTKKLDGVREVLEQRIAPVLLDTATRPSGKGGIQVSPAELVVEVTRSVARAKGGTYVDALLEGSAARSRTVDFEFYDPRMSGKAPENELPIGRVLEIRREQLKFLSDFYGDAENAALISKQKGLQLNSDDDWRKFVLAKFDALKTDLGDENKALSGVIDILKRYLSAFTIHSKWNIEDFGGPGANYLGRRFPRALTGQLVHDCGVYALRIAYILSLVRDKLKLRFRFVRLPEHLALVISGPGRSMFVANNNDIAEVNQETLARMLAQWDGRDPKAKVPAGATTVDDDAFAATVAAGFHLPRIDTPYRVTDEPKLAAGDKASYWTMYKKLQEDVLKPGSGDTEQFQLRYLKALDDYKQIYNDKVRRFWNQDAREVWRVLGPRLLDAFDRQRREGTDAARAAYRQACAAFKQALQKKRDPIETALVTWQKDSDATSAALAAHRELLARDVRIAKAKRLSIDFPWRQDLTEYFTLVLENETDLADPAKRDRLVPPFLSTSLPPME